jgi:hypothetical protein
MIGWQRVSGAAARSLSAAIVAGLFCGASAAAGATVEVHDGTLSVVQGPGEQSRVSLGANANIPGQWHAEDGRWAGGGRYSASSYFWPGVFPAAGPGCQGAAAGLDCTGVTSVAVALGDGDDVVAVRGGGLGSVSLSGGGGRDALTATGVKATLDGGPGDDVLIPTAGQALGGDGADLISLVQPLDPALTVDCGPGDDTIHYAALGSHSPPSVDAASCPPILDPLISTARPQFPGDGALVFWIPADRKVRLALFRPSEAARGTVRLMRPATKGGGRCAAPVSFAVRAGKAVAPTFTILPTIARRVAGLGPRRGVFCEISFAGTDLQGERFAATHFDGMLFVSRRAPNGRLP